MPKSIPTTLKKPMLAKKPNKPNMMAGPKKYNKPKQDELEEEIESLMPDAMKAKDYSIQQQAPPAQPKP
jgi:hypothetical protein